MSDQININVTDLVPPENLATIDQNSYVGNTLSKPQLDAKFEDLREEITTDVSKIAITGSKGEATPTSSPTPYDPVTYPKGLFEKWDIKTPGTYTNFKDASSPTPQPIVVTADDLNGKQVQIWVTNGVSKLDVTALPKATQYIPTWTSQSYTGLTQVIKDNQVWELPLGQSTTSAEIPGTSNKWIEKIGVKVEISSQFNPVTETEAQGGKQITEFFLQSKNKFDKSNLISGYIDTTTGVIKAFANSYMSQPIKITPNTFYYLSGRTSTLESWRFLDASGNILKPIDNAGNPYSVFDTNVLNGKILTPSNAAHIQFQVTFNNIGSATNVQFEEGESATSYSDFNLKLKPTLLPQASALLKKISVIKNGNDVTMRSDFNSINNDVVVVFTKSGGNNVFNFKSAKLIGKSGAVTETGLPLHGADTDDVTPMRINDMYIGANHGNSGALTLTATAHGKTLTDVGSKWVDNQGQIFIILKIIDVNKILIISTNRGVGTWDFKGGITFPLTHSSGAVNTSSIASGTTVLTQLYPAIKNHVQKIILDEKEVSVDGNYDADNITFSESYDIIDTPDMLDKLVVNKPVGGYTTQPDFLNGDSLMTLNINYTFTDGLKLIVDWNFIVNKSLKFIYYGGTQANYYKPTWATEFKRIYPNSLPISDGLKTWDFKLPQDILGNFNSAMNLTTAYWQDANNPVIRSVDNFQSTVKSVNFNIGFIPIFSQQTRKNQIDNAWYLYTSKKQYPYGIDSKIGDTLPPNTFRSGTSFRGWSERTAARFNQYLFQKNNSWYLILDYIGAQKDTITLPKELIGKKINILQSSNALVLSEVVTEKINVISTGVGFAYLEIY